LRVPSSDKAAPPKARIKEIIPIICEQTFDILTLQLDRLVWAKAPAGVRGADFSKFGADIAGIYKKIIAFCRIQYKENRFGIGVWQNYGRIKNLDKQQIIGKLAAVVGKFQKVRRKNQMLNIKKGINNDRVFDSSDRRKVSSPRRK
jgi:hypothetical protein